VFLASALLAAAADSNAPARKPYAVLNPPAGITPAMTREPFSWSFPQQDNPDPNVPGRLPRRTWTPAERRAYEASLKWFHEAKYGIFFHYLSDPDWNTWDSEKWNKWVDAVDVEKLADQAKEIGAGYVFITLGQSVMYSCAPNAVIEKVWGSQYTSKRDLPMDLYKALEKRGIAMMLYIATDHQHGMPRPTSLKESDLFDRWIEVAQWYSDHYGTRCKGWWVDGLLEFTKDYRINIHKALKHGNPQALVASGTLEISDFLHGHCMPDWGRQSKVVKPFFGRWDPDFNIQWHVFQYVGPSWAEPG